MVAKLYYFFDAPYGPVPNHPNGLYYYRGIVPESKWLKSFKEYEESGLAFSEEEGVFIWGEDEGFVAIEKSKFENASDEELYQWMNIDLYGTSEDAEKDEDVKVYRDAIIEAVKAARLNQPSDNDYSTSIDKRAQGY